MTIDEPARIARLPHDHHGRPVPWFVAWIDGKPDFRIIKPGAVEIAWASRLCWVCGMLIHKAEPKVFTIGPMCAVNRVSAEPPGHYDCAVYSARACPFLSTPNMIRRERHVPEGTSDPPGIFLRRNPGVAAVWIVKRNTAKIVPAPDGNLFDIGVAQWVEWYARGRSATRREVVASIESGLPLLVEACNGDDAQLAQLDTQHAEAMRLLPA